MSRFLSVLVAVCGIALCAQAQESEQDGSTPAAAKEPLREGLLGEGVGYSARPITMPEFVVRLDMGPSDFGFMDHGAINGRRGFRVRTAPGSGSSEWFMGIGAAVSVSDDLELGALIAPVRWAPDNRYTDPELYARYRLADFLAAQLTMLFGVETDTGLGIGLPMRFQLDDWGRIDTGLEGEMIFSNSFEAHLDVPVAFSVDIGDAGFVGARTGLFLSDFQDLAIDLGFHLGVMIGDYTDVSYSMRWPTLIWTGAGSSTNPDIYEMVVGLTVYLDARPAAKIHDRRRQQQLQRNAKGG